MIEWSQFQDAFLHHVAEFLIFCWSPLSLEIGLNITVQAACLLWALVGRGDWPGSLACFLLLPLSLVANPCSLVENLLLLIDMKEFSQNSVKAIINQIYKQEFPLSANIQNAFLASLTFDSQQPCKHHLLQNCFQSGAQGFSFYCVP